MPSTVVVRGAGGALFEVDAPAAGRALDHWNEKLAKGDLVVVDEPVEWVPTRGGGKRLQIAEKPAPAPKTKPKATKPEPDTEKPEPDSEE